MNRGAILIFVAGALALGALIGVVALGAGFDL
jgi:hypothetical protein